MKKALCVVSLVLLGCGGETNKWSGSTELDFISGCASQGATKDFCYCALDYVEARYSEEELKKVSKDELDQLIVDAVDECL